MAHHLAALVVAAEGEDVSLEQRTEIIDTILKVWAARKTFPGEVPTYQLDRVFLALDILGDDRPWRFSRLRNMQGMPTDDAQIPLAVLAVNLESLTRQALLALIWLAWQDAIANDAHWVEAAKAVGESIEDELATSTRQVSRRLLDLTGDIEWNPQGEGEGDDERAETAMITRRLRAMSVELTTLADQLERGADGVGLGTVTPS